MLVDTSAHDLMEFLKNRILLSYSHSHLFSYFSLAIKSKKGGPGITTVPQNQRETLFETGTSCRKDSLMM